MKKSLLILLVLIPALSFSQIYIDFGLGAEHSTYTTLNGKDDEVKVSRTLPVFTLALGAEINHFIIEASEQPTITKEANSPNLLGFKVGYNVSGLVPLIGYYYNLANGNDNKYNSWNVGYGLKYKHKINNNAGLFAEGLAVGKNYSLTAGISYKF